MKRKSKKMFRRLFARLLDYIFYFTIWILIVLFVHQWIGLSGQVWFSCFVIGFFIAPIALMLLAEPFLLHLFGATFGKWLFGISVIYDRGGKIPIEKARIRTIRVMLLWHGDYRFRSFFRFMDMVEVTYYGGTLDWDYEASTSPVVRKIKNWKIILPFVVIISLFMVLLCSYYRAEMPKYRGNLTKEQFIENYNRLARFYNTDNRFLDEHGVWQEKVSTGVKIYINGEPPIYPKQMHIIETDGIVTEISFSVEAENRISSASSYIDIMKNAVLAFVGASKEISVLEREERQELMEYIRENAYKDFLFEKAGIVISCDIEMQGYELFANEFYRPKEEENYYKLTFKMEKK